MNVHIAEAMAVLSIMGVKFDVTDDGIQPAHGLPLIRYADRIGSLVSKTELRAVICRFVLLTNGTFSV